MARVKGCEAVYEVANQWRERCLERDRSLLWPDLEEPTWTAGNIETLKKHLYSKQAEESSDFFIRLSARIQSEPEAIHRLSADISALWSLMPGWYLPSTKMGWLDGLISSLNLTKTPVTDLLQQAFGCRLCSSEAERGGHAYRRSEQMKFMLEFALQIHVRSLDTVTEKDSVKLAWELVPQIPYSDDAQHILLHLLFPDSFEAISSGKTKKEVVLAFTGESAVGSDLDAKLSSLRSDVAIKAENGADFSYYDADIRDLWMPVTSQPGVTPSMPEESRTPRYWKISPGEGGQLWTRFRDESAIWLGWDGSPNLIELKASSAEALLEALDSIPDYVAHNYAKTYASKQLWTFFKEMSAGDGVCCYSNSTVYGWGTIVGDYEYDDSRDVYKHKRSVHWESTEPIPVDKYSERLKKQLQLRQTISELTADEFAILSGEPLCLISLADFAELTFIQLLELEEINSLLLHKKQLILEGPPGSGKTFVARLFARYLAELPLVGPPDPQVEIVQFHQSYGYEDFVAGIRPRTTPEGNIRYDVQPGIFIEMCKRADANPTRNFVLIIDEINRGNLSRIFGELLYALEYRDEPVRIQYPDMMGDESADHLTIPKNLYLIGTMNSTDRSLAMIDYALRRRFYFWSLMPVVDHQAPVLEGWLRSQGIDDDLAQSLLGRFVALNERIAEHMSPDHQIGHSYVMVDDLQNPDTLERVWKRALLPLLGEYFHNRRDREALIDELRAIILGS